MNEQTPELVEKGGMPCVTCGEPHDCYRLDGILSWADLDDGHVYRPLSYEAIGRAAVDNNLIDLRALARSHG